ncbi:hypothetical protein DLAC_07702 [Tieghemostelium lacteum]|uniref:THH1/TOM1/TOM3 domain-containing protein n=1 Tax=Tieghemostelium lacteum TaxID=361077 RepID=A0A151ZAA9_TIELA|nr:hypothetical protein DLAC_07702 [Tieghemostelium lacteum]|eukprot:KYQ90834.1 hypothetical protein DLAC_07702 [Tieghemostelium lacteum]
MQLLYTFFISKEIRLRNTVKVWYFSWFVSFLALLYTIAYTVLSRFSYNSAKTFYTAGFLIIIVVFGITLIINGLILSKEIKKHEKNSANSEKMTSSVSKIRRLAFTLLFTVVAALVRDLVFLFVKSGPLDNIKTFSAFYTFVLETAQGVIVMFALADKPINYIKFKRVYRSHTSQSNSSNNSSGNVVQSGKNNTLDESRYNSGNSVNSESNSINMTNVKIYEPEISESTNNLIENQNIDSSTVTVSIQEESISNNNNV